ncbi:hypothetical protein COV18_01250 [Candidatus Woesearchaeota archaeon CG10_big_fil_rev_8_21_14_0_10_37_12]|nr:MAG: hypothetical protein COV18_01250 [Candidatus Woesearchaeota archaeon CG10_big_fil_rev_8_21_14_0_10_37_12]
MKILFIFRAPKTRWFFSAEKTRVIPRQLAAGIASFQAISLFIGVVGIFVLIVIHCCRQF